MSMASATRCIAAAAGLAVAVASAQGVLYGWNYAKGQPGSGTQYGRNDTGGTVESINSSFDSSNNRLTFDVLFSGANNSSGPLATNGFWLVLDNGPDPKTHTGELAIFYFDASRVFAGTAANPTLTAYEYNGTSANTSWRDGNGDGSIDGGDLIKGAYEGASFINSASAATQVIGGQTLRRLRFDINASAIISHLPLFTTPGQDWVGTGFDSHLGIWFHPAQIFNAAYESAGGGHRGAITSLATTYVGSLDGGNFSTFTIPAPQSAAVLGLGVLIAARRRRAS